MTRAQVELLRDGVYVLYWVSGGLSVAAVGSNEAGDKWFTPTNWITVPSYDWSTVDSADLITTQELERESRHEQQRQQWNADAEDQS